ncbi:MAG: 4a-hydroxytetrahydrobiopterin dehydratase [Cyanobacteria bacterium J06635_1]
MLSRFLITATTVAISLAEPPQPPGGWQINNDRLECTYELADFVESVAFVEQLVAPAETLGHHPDVAIAYNRVSLSLTTHDADGLTDLDYQLAEEISAIATHQTPPLSCLNADE